MNEIQIQQSICSKTLKILEPYIYKPYLKEDSRQELETVINKKVRHPFYRSIEMPIGEYVHILNLTLQGIDRDLYNEASFAMAGALHTNCTGEIELEMDRKVINDRKGKTFTKKTILFASTIKKEFIDIDDEPQEMKKYFDDEFLKRYIECPSEFTSIVLGMQSPIGGHRNIILILTTDTDIYLHAYEPHGSQPVKTYEDFKKMRDKALNYIKKLLKNKFPNKRVTIVPLIHVSRVEGFQTFSKDNQGFCGIISCLWLYILLKLMKVCTPEEQIYIHMNMNIIEECVINKFPLDTGNVQLDKYNLDKIYSIIVYFGYDMLTSLLINIQDHQKFKNEFKEIFQIFQTQMTQHLPFYKKIFYSNERRSTRSTNDYYYDWYNKLSEYWFYNGEQYVTKQDGVHQYIRKNLKNRKEDGLPCEQHKECISDNCVNNKCTSYIRREIGSECKQDDQCISNYCDLKESKCKVYDYGQSTLYDEPNKIPFRKSLIRKPDGNNCFKNGHCISDYCDLKQHKCSPHPDVPIKKSKKQTRYHPYFI